MGRAPCCEKVGLKRGRWTAEEDEILRNYIQAKGVGSWRSLPKNAGLLRCGKSCRLRWINYLRSDLKRGNISAEEEEIIIKLHATFGNRWSLIAGHLSGRTDNEIKNYWSSHLSRKIHSLSSHLNRKNHSFRRRPRNKALPAPPPPPPPPPPLSMDIAKSGVAASKPRGSPTSRAATKKNKLSYIPPTKAPKLLQKLQDSEAGMVGSSGEEREGLVLCHGDEERESRSSVLSSGGDRENEELFCLHLLEIMGDELVDLESGGKGYYCRSSTNSYMEEVNWKWDAVVEGHEIWGWGKREDGDLGV